MVRRKKAATGMIVVALGLFIGLAIACQDVGFLVFLLVLAVAVAGLAITDVWRRR